MPRSNPADGTIQGRSSPVTRLVGTPLRWRVTLLLLASGASALVYQVVWLRALRLVFGTTTAAVGTTLAIFLGGLGIGALVLGRRADRAADPLRLYAGLEAGVAAGALVSLPLIGLVRVIYVSLGGTSGLGPVAATVLRVASCAAVLALPTFLMGGTLPAAARALEHAADRSRRTVGLLYGVNTVGAVLGTLWATFVALERWGTTVTLLCAGGVNLAVAAWAFALTRRTLRRAQGGPAAAARDREAARPDPGDGAPAAPVWLVLGAAGAVGAAFVLMEIVWYRMLAPILGGSAYTIGLILAMALLGIGLGGLLYAIGRPERRPTLWGFTMSCLLEALFIIAPYALGDRVAVLAMDLRAWAQPGFAWLVGTWAAVTAIVVLPAALAAGYQFPLLIALLGTRERDVGREVGWAYATNTAGAIAGSLAGGFGLLPLLSAPGLWRAVTGLLVAVGGVTAAWGWRRTPPVHWLAPAVLLVTVSLALGTADGPTAFWRHGAIGAGRAQAPEPGPNGVRQLQHADRAALLWEAEGKESSIAVDRADGYSLVVNGKSDGNVLGDAPTQVMSGLVAALLHPEPRRALVIGLGSGSTAGWLGAVPSIERVDVVELEPAVLRVAELCAPANLSVLTNPKVHVTVGDGREVLLTTRARYDVIFSEPSNPYRAGVASMFTREFYRAAAARLRPGGILAQWVQAYEIQPESIEAVYATLATVFPSVETWEVNVEGDLLLVATLEPRVHDATVLRARVLAEPYRTALERIWGVSGLEGLYTGYIANADFAAELARHAGRINTDDRTILEFELARSVGEGTAVNAQRMRAAAARRHQNRPSMAGALDWTHVDELRTLRALSAGRVPDDVTPDDPAAHARVLARQAYAAGKFAEASQLWGDQGGGPQGPMDLTMLAEILAAGGDARGRQAIDSLRALQPAEAEAIEARARYAAGDRAGAAQRLAAAFALYRSDPWAHRQIFTHALQLAWRLSSEDPAQGDALFEALTPPFSVRALDMPRLFTRAVIGLHHRAEQQCGEALAPFEPNVPWEGDLLERRATCYVRLGSPLAKRAKADLETFQAARRPASIEAPPR